MIKYALIFLLAGIVLSVAGFYGAAGVAYSISKFLGIAALVLFAVLLILGVTAANRVAH